MCALFVGVIFARGILLRCLRAWERNRGRCVQLSELGWAGFPSSDTTHTPATDRRGFLVKSQTHPRRAMVIRRFGPEIPRVPRTRSASLLPDQPVPIRPEKAWDLFRFGSDGISRSTSGTPVPVDSLGGGPISPASKAGKRTPLSAPTSPGAVVHNCETPHVDLWGGDRAGSFGQRHRLAWIDCPTSMHDTATDALHPKDTCEATQRDVMFKTMETFREGKKGVARKETGVQTPRMERPKKDAIRRRRIRRQRYIRVPQRQCERRGGGTWKRLKRCESR